MTLIIQVLSPNSEIKTEDLFLTIAFKADTLAFDMESFNVDPLTCSLADLYWKMDIPSVKHSEI